MTLLENSGEILDGEIKVISLYLRTSLKSLLLIGPITIFIPCDLMSLIAELSFSLSSNPVSLGIIKTFLSLISSRANCKEYKREFPNCLY